MVNKPTELPPAVALGEGYFNLDSTLAALEVGEPVTFPPFHVTRARIGTRDFTFCTNYEDDPIQKCNRKGCFYEYEDLQAVAEVLPPAPRVLDVGANVGNHALFFATQCGAESVIVVEPNPLVLAPLVANIVLNGLTGVINTEALGIGLGSASEGGLFMPRRGANLGGSKILREKRGRGFDGLEVHPGDALFPEERFDLIKIDVEGMEMEVLAGLEETIARCRPALFIEVDNENDKDFHTWCATRRYTIHYTKRRYEENKNYLLQPSGDNT